MICIRPFDADQITSVDLYLIVLLIIMSAIYPAAPGGIGSGIVQPSAAFRAEVSKVTLALVGFTVLYLTLIAASVIVAAGFAIVGYFIITNIRHWFAIALAIGLLGVGVMVLVFVFKFLFASKRTDNSSHVEITEEEQPELFEFIRRISVETGTKFPKHIYLSPEVNAMVFYDSNFWSMLLPVRKNLVIGLGLVNMTNLSEFKAVIAHEFGHFSQKSMRAGSFVYQANKVIFNLLYKNQGYSNALNTWASVHWTFGLCAQMTAGIVNSIQWTLREAYKGVNKRYMSLSRQMEFHADAVAAACAGGNNAASALRRIEFAEVCYQSVLGHYNTWIAKAEKGRNIYSDQRFVAQKEGQRRSYEFVAELPVVNTGDGDASRSRISITNQWASHPSLSQREAALAALSITCDVEHGSPWALFRDTGSLQEMLTGMLYENVEFKGPPKLVEEGAFENVYVKSLGNFNLPEVFQGYYNNRSIAGFTPDQQPSAADEIDDFKTFFGTQEALPRQLAVLDSDLEQLDMIEEHADAIRVFDYEGEKRKAREVPKLREELKLEREALVKKIDASDQRVYRAMIAMLGAHSPEAMVLEQAYHRLSTVHAIVNARFELCSLLVDKIQGFHGQMTVEVARRQDQELRNACRDFSESMESVNKAVAEIPGLEGRFEPYDASNFNKHTWQFMNLSNELLPQNLQELFYEVKAFGTWNAEVRFYAQQAMLETQAELIERINGARGLMAAGVEREVDARQPG